MHVTMIVSSIKITSAMFCCVLIQTTSHGDFITYIYVLLGCFLPIELHIAKIIIKHVRSYVDC